MSGGLQREPRWRIARNVRASSWQRSVSSSRAADARSRGCFVAEYALRMHGSTLRLLALLVLASVGCAGATVDPTPTSIRDAVVANDAAPTRDAAMSGDAAPAIDAAVLSDVGSDAGCATLDCSNAACAHASCEIVPTDWTGPFALYDGPERPRRRATAVRPSTAVMRV